MEKTIITKTQVRHTPGPWFWKSAINEKGKKYFEICIRKEDGSLPSHGSADTLSDAELIAAAPELLEAATKVVRAFTKPYLLPEIDALADAVNRAEGN